MTKQQLNAIADEFIYQLEHNYCVICERNSPTKWRSSTDLIKWLEKPVLKHKLKEYIIRAVKNNLQETTNGAS